MYTSGLIITFIYILYKNINICSAISVNIATLTFHSPKFGMKCLSSMPQMEPFPEMDLGLEKADSASEQIGSDLLAQKLRKTAESIRSEAKEVGSTKEEREKETSSWLVVLHNDDIHSFQFVTETLAQCIPHLSLAKAHTITVEAHSSGKAIILATWRDRANMYCESLQRHGLTVSTMYTNQNDK